MQTVFTSSIRTQSRASFPDLISKRINHTAGPARGSAVFLCACTDTAFITDTDARAALQAEIDEKGSIVEIKTEWGNIGVLGYPGNASMRAEYLATGNYRYMVIRMFETADYLAGAVKFPSDSGAATAMAPVAGEWVDYVIDMKDYWEGNGDGWGVINLGARLKVDGYNYTYFSDIYFTAYAV